jgi:hypothetical protein
MKNNIQKAIDQIGEYAVSKAIGAAVLHRCEIHGMYACPTGQEPSCPLCPDPNGTDATQVEHYIDMKNFLDPTSGTNPQQKAYGV